MCFKDGSICHFAIEKSEGSLSHQRFKQVLKDFLKLKSGCKWWELGNMWEEGKRRRLGKIIVLEGEG
ncbi:hypothetical protein ACH5RR_037707 [Cinchona calisaya]|uniref:Uncharacterized protein n=1 Tax=Cinchona calisaya TaxID=153742 RepID=A0ABD2Y8A4_9GENT